ncbi:MAG: exodeoxyribonuclease VII small subunit [Oscillospiraceae bacterium]|jgi:exodeoxyribonuclease VII small subunit|nr:exodeoxyribonuclease VII small subunit [Oscillospiraceae bacterium]
MAKNKLGFEQSMDRLDAIVKRLETGEAPLNDSLALFEEGTALIASCAKLLDEAEQKVVMLRKGENGEPEELPFGGGDGV